MVVLKAKQSFLTMQYSAFTTSTLYLYKAGHGPTHFLNCDNSGTQDEKLEIMITMYITLMIDYINLLISMAIFTHGVEKRLYELNFSNTLITSSATFS